jgi:hypothetical protein
MLGINHCCTCDRAPCDRSHTLMIDCTRGPHNTVGAFDGLKINFKSPTFLRDSRVFLVPINKPLYTVKEVHFP